MPPVVDRGSACSLVGLWDLLSFCSRAEQLPEIRHPPEAAHEPLPMGAQLQLGTTRELVRASQRGSVDDGQDERRETEGIIAGRGGRGETVRE